ncbi:hypothetical protein EJ05DRAFT_538747 [Pseudovirgaria hyperparasitica]|uniref:F-box domain-containing protein n=1 Tax=Pseudovirgaria hyperparasitica TaxID=470096 RepID=A0A6A6W6P0_9PEZI|nr:uncharacterized protein EJ05DRAFT_538747 [Pseudovirgaria hyperparasitica]KAF2757576.1 hypothetical protein EJ05DRAFT_538747 [Pseudovirgaria hyperparasitica]
MDNPQNFTPPSSPTGSKPAAHLPNEILLQILSYIPTDPALQPTLAALCLTNTQWHTVTIARLYAHPHIRGANFDLFTRTIVPSINLHIKRSDLASLVHTLDLSHIVHHSTKKTTARLLGRTKASLQVFVAPQTGFALNSYPALAHCARLRVLDLRLVCESVDFRDLGRALAGLRALEVLFFPRTGVRDGAYDGADIRWPALRELHLAGGLSGVFMAGLQGRCGGNLGMNPAGLPTTLTRLSVTNSPVLECASLVRFLAGVGGQLRVFTTCSLPRFRRGDLDDLLVFCPRLEKVSVAAEFWTGRAVAREEFRGLPAHSLSELRVTKSEDSVHEDEITPVDIEVGIEYGFLGGLRRVVVNVAVGWVTNFRYHAG